MSIDVKDIRAKAATKRRRNTRHMIRLLKEYSAKLCVIVNDLNEASHRLDSWFGTRANPRPPELLTMLERRAVLGGVLERVVRMASGMIEEYDLDSLDYAELVLRLRETEHGLEAARRAAEAVVVHFPKLFPNGVPKDAGFEWPPVREKAIGAQVGLRPSDA